MNDKIEVPTMQVPPLKRICMTIGQLPTSYLETMSYYEMLVWFVNYLRDDIIPVVNANGLATKELQELFVTLQNYVNNYFDNLDLQEEVDNKLEEMADSGQLTDIIAQYLGLAGMITFDTVTDMKLAENLVNGSKCATLGYRAVNDGGNALYKVRTITNDDVVDDMFIIELNDNSLIAELIIDEEVNVKQIGAYGNGTNDDTNVITKALSKANNIYLPSGTYNLTNPININSKNIRGDNYNQTIINEVGFTTPREHFIEISGTNNIKDLCLQKSFSGTGDYKLAKVCGLKNCYESVFENVYFKSDGYSTGGTIDLYTNNHNITFDNCKSYLYSKDSSNNNEEGGIWIRENNSEGETYNITLINCNIYHQSKDEILGIWNWNGQVHDVFINNSYLKCPSANTAPHYISLAGDNIQFNNCTLINLTTQSVGQSNKFGSIFHVVAGHTGKVYVNNCFVTFNSGLVNGITANETTGEVYINNSIIKGGNYNTPIGKAIYNSDNITAGIMELTFSKCYNCEFNYLNSAGNYKIAQSSFELYNCNLNNLICDQTILIQIFTTGGTIIIRNTTFNGTFTPLRFIHIGSSNSLAKLEIENSNIAAISGGEYITSGIINNCTSKTAITTVGSLTINNVIVY